MEHPLIKPATFEDLNLLKLQKVIEDKYSVKFENYWDFHKWSVDNFEQFWEETWHYLGIISSVPFDRVIEQNKTIEELPEWFPGARLNFAENLLHHQEGSALIVLGEEKPVPKYVSYKQLREQVSTLTSALQKAGIKKGDIISCFMSNREEAVIALLASAAIGAMFTAANPLMGVQPVVSRFNQLKPKVLFTINKHSFNKEVKNFMDILPDIVRGLPSLELVVIVPSNEESLSEDISCIPNSCFFPDLMKTGLSADGLPPVPYYEQLPFSHPFVISFTSGTTGPPKGVVHSAGSVLLVPLKDLSLHFNTKKSDIYWTFYSTGWMSWNFYLTALGLGTTLVVYEGMPFFQHDNGYWDIADKLGVTVSFLIPSVLEEMQKRNTVPGPNNSLSKLHTMLSGGCHVKSHTFDFVYNCIKPEIHYTVGYGSTETMAMVAGITRCLPVYKEELQAPALSMGISTYNEEGKSVVDEMAELVITKPFPTMPLYFWNDEGHRKYKSTFFERFPGVFCHSDMCIISSKTGGLIVFGRTDETIKQRGARFGSSEIYEIVNKMEGVSDSLCVSKRNKDGDEIAVLFVKVKSGYSFTPQMVNAIRENVKNELSYRHVPEVIHPVKDIPYNMNGKKMEVLVKKILACSTSVSLDTAANPDSLLEYQEFAKSM